MTDKAIPAAKPAKKEETIAKAVVRALKTPVTVPGATLAKGGKATIDLKTAEHKAKEGEVTIVEVL